MKKSKILVAFLLTLSSAVTATVINSPSDNLYQKRILGDKAFDNGLYSVAMNYYENYLKDANGDSPAIRDAYYCLISTCLRSNNINEAKRLYKELASKFDKYYSTHPEDERKLNFWQAEILLSDGKLKEAETIFNTLLANVSTSSDEITLNAMAGKALVELRNGNYGSARMLYSNLQSKAASKKDKELENLAYEEIIMIDLLNGSYDSAKAVMEEANKSSLSSKNIKIKLLNVYLLSKQGHIDQALSLFNELKTESLGPDNLWYFITYSLAKDCVENKKLVQSKVLINDAFALAPSLYEKEQATILKINTLLQLNEYSQAISVAKLFLETFPNSNTKLDVLYTLSESMIKEKMYSDVAALADKYFDFSPSKNPEAIKLAEIFGKNSTELKQYDEAVNYFDFILHNSEDRATLGEALLYKAEISYDRKNYLTAIQQYQDISKNYPTLKEEAMLRIGQTQIAMTNYQDASGTLQSLISEYPDSNVSPSPMFVYAIALEKLGKTNDAINEYIKYATNDKTKEDADLAYYEAASLALSIGNSSDAIKYLDILIKNYPQSSDLQLAYYKLVFAYLSIQNYDKAATYAEILSKKYPKSKTSIQTSFWLSDYYQENKQYNEAIRKLDVIINSTDDTAVISEAYYKKAFDLYLANELDKAQKIIQSLQTKYPDSEIIPSSYYLQGDILSQIGNYDDAITSYSSAYEKTSSQDIEIATLGRIGDCYFAMVNYSQDKKQTLEEAISYYNKVLEIKNLSLFTKTQTLYKVGKTYELLGNINKAIESYHEAFYDNIIAIEEGKNPTKIWMTKSAISLTRLLQEENTQEGAVAALDILNDLVKYKIEPISDFKQRIKEIKNLYKL